MKTKKIIQILFDWLGYIQTVIFVGDVWAVKGSIIMTFLSSVAASIFYYTDTKALMIFSSITGALSVVVYLTSFTFNKKYKQSRIKPLEKNSFDYFEASKKLHAHILLIKEFQETNHIDINYPKLKTRVRFNSLKIDLFNTIDSYKNVLTPKLLSWFEHYQERFIDVKYIDKMVDEVNLVINFLESKISN